MTSMTRIRRIVMYAVVLVVTSMIVAVLMLTSGPKSSATPAGIPTPTVSRDMPGMGHGSSEAPGKPHDDGAAGSPWKLPDHVHTVEVVPDRPLASVLGIFGVGTSAVLLTAGYLRRKDRARGRVRQAARAARRDLK